MTRTVGNVALIVALGFIAATCPARGCGLVTRLFVISLFGIVSFCLGTFLEGQAGAWVRPQPGLWAVPAAAATFNGVVAVVTTPPVQVALLVVVLMLGLTSGAMWRRFG